MSRSSGITIIACLFMVITKEVEGQIIIPPSNAVAEVSGEAIFNCSTTLSPPFWVLTRDGGTTDEIFIAVSCVVNAGLENHYRTEQPGGLTTCILIVYNITMEQAGVYRCTESDTHLALLTVLDSSPTVTYNSTSAVIEGETVVIACTLNYNGSVEPAYTLRPHFYWTDYAGRNVSSVYDSTPVNSPVISQIAVTAGRQDIMPYTCHVYLNLIPSTSYGYPNNTPPVNSRASSPIITVLDMSSEMTTMGAISGPGLTTPQPDGVTTDAYVPPEPCTRSTAVYVNFEPEVDTHGVQISSRIIRRGSPKCIVVCQKQCSASIAKCTDRPCRNNGTCVDISTGYRCECPLGFTGTNCEQELDCDGVTCVQGLASYGG